MLPKPGTENRRESRVAAKGNVHIRLDEDGAAEILGSLLDTSARGFRACHSYAALPKGQTVTFRHPGASGHARVVWNRITPDAVETGFVIV